MTRRCRWCSACSTRCTASGARCAACATLSNSSRPRCARRSAAPCRGPEAKACRFGPRASRPHAAETAAVLLLLQRLKSRAGAAFDAGGDQLVNVETVAHQFEDAQFLLARLAVGRRDIAGDGIGRLAQFAGQRRLDRREGVLEPGLAAEQPAAFLPDARPLLPSEAAENREVPAGASRGPTP